MTAIELRGVTKEFADVTAVRDLDLTVEDGEVYGFLGPNGAGKSTTIDMVLDLVRPTEGTVRVLGQDATADGVAIRRRTGVLPDGFSVYDRLSGRKHVEFAVRSKETDDDPDALLERVGLLGDADRKAGGYSKGMRQRLALAMALVGEPDLLILDEPSSGLDPAGAKEMREIVQSEADRGATVFFSSHILEQVDAVCDRVGILRDGELVAEDSVEGLREAVGSEETLEIAVGDADAAATDAVRDLDGVTRVDRDGNTLVVSCADDAKTRVIAALEDAGVVVRDFHTREASLEDLFLAYTEGDAPGVDGSGGSSDADDTDADDTDDTDAATDAEEVAR
ncbi:ABC transporter [Halorubrum aidingense JCM 13560]|uniref:ABC transporter n=1 Tax=Halorubrum aidingense JCM 13560 TaxID=1230454 RepID=M0PAY6_9EURY|nr:ABC transporter ATP-binding protein [Halorubrum aidingense]EMA65985.1 ABC transporter [Halorubrum aidingense JCM 13560]